MFRKLLVANRGEIACRIFRTCRRLGIRSAAIYSEADRHALHVREADEAHHIGPAAASESYLCIDRIVEVARACGADAVHPGYGFLSESAEFAEACEAAGVVFVGPPAAAIRAMGSKSAAKTLMEKAGVGLVPGYHGDEQDTDFLETRAGEIGFPVMIKASAGGGGKGMRIANRREDFAAALASCQREGKASFGDARVLVEKYLERPRHIEMQIFADTHGNVVHLFERDCSVQRRHQKVLEEAPAPEMTRERRREMGDAAIDAARAVGYVGAGTVEFIVEGASAGGRFYFMEMNTRLQVEHPVTEMVTGLDLVEWQLRIATGDTLPRRQDEIEAQGHAIEARIYAEDPGRGFLPSPGRIVHFSPPAESARVRVEAGAARGDEITPFYDPMIAKLVTWGETRDAALSELRGALAAFRIGGVSTNIAFLRRVAAEPDFASGVFDTGLIERRRESLLPKATAPSDEVWIAAAMSLVLEEATTSTDPWDARDGWRLSGRAPRELRLECRRSSRTLQIVDLGETHRIQLDESPYTVRAAAQSGQPAQQLGLEIDGRSIAAEVVVDGDRRHVFIGDEVAVLTLSPPELAAASDTDTRSDLSAPMPGQVISLNVEPGVAVAKGECLLVLEAMKMEHPIHAPSNGVVKRFLFAVGDRVPEATKLLEFEPASN